MTDLTPDSRLIAVDHDVTNEGPGKWGLSLRFTLDTSGARRVIKHRFHVYVGGEDDGLGAKVGDLKFEGYVIVGDT
jgi:hypothetical protein